MTYANGDKEVLYFKDFNSGAMIENIVDRAKKMAIKDLLEHGQQGHPRRSTCSTACVDEFRENEDLPNTTNPDDWARISGKKGERIVFIRTLVQGKRAPRPAGRSTPSPTPASTCRRRGPRSRPRGSGRLRSTHERPPGDGDRDRVRHLRARRSRAPTRCCCRSQVVNAYAAQASRARRARWDYEEEPAARRPRLRRSSARRRRPEPADRRRPRAGQRHPDQRRAALRRPRAPGVLHARGDATRATRCCGTRPASWSWPRRRGAPRTMPGSASRSTSTRTTPTTRAPPTARTRTT